ncbi:MAG: hypothetical protein COW01_05920 [Bdellovibrionales bacterium CG12_big_fil_rev_8_21_14_0_65_38_15]|nr:MAG: hypothetical protein COW79_03815 [Bdellovibrionales bacterium CG22_combo_CG10-13_8_21_14_all_38_13]PIQ55969.1 MAG: hypothetical protein COW01_05920 [Bdellovibrionales bacterium CG12_big_fil_rev_8_21_14_0_65_38_15]
MTFRISKLFCEQFRNLDHQAIEFHPGINCITGDNGNGKTNILEAIYFLSQKKSFRKNTGFPQILSADGEKPEILLSALYENDESKFTISGKMRSEKIDWAIDGRPVKRRDSYPAIFVNPMDSFSFHQVPGFRRSWFDDHFSMLDPTYKSLLNQFQKSLRFRNALLSKKPNQYLAQIKASDEQFAKINIELLERKKILISEIVLPINETFKSIFSMDHELDLKVESALSGMNTNAVLKLWSDRQENDVLRGHTTRGVHKDDYVLLFDGMNAFEYCSLGQQKMAYLSLLFAYITLFRYKFSSFPIVLIDDVSGELDRFRWQKLVAHLKESKFQVFITTANENFKMELLNHLDDAKHMEVCNGKII